MLCVYNLRASLSHCLSLCLSVCLYTHLSASVSRLDLITSDPADARLCRPVRNWRLGHHRDSVTVDLAQIPLLRLVVDLRVFSTSFSSVITAVKFTG